MSARFFARQCAALVIVVLVAVAVLLPASACAQTQTAVEYYYADWNFYFVTSDPGEIAALDGGAFGGVWKRTGQTFQVWTDPINGALPTYRFFSVIFAPKSSHFYTPYANEYTSLQAGTAWQLEGTAFYVLLPDGNGNCPAGTTVLYRLYNQAMGGAPNHRFTVSVATFNTMQAQGWQFEGDGRTGAYACVPSGPAIPSPVAGFWDGTTSTGLTVFGIVLDDGSFYFFLIAPDNSSLELVSGTSTADNGAFQSDFARSFEFGAFGLTASNASMAGSYTSQSSFNGTLAVGTANETFATSYDNSYEQPASLAAAAGAYSGVALSADGAQQIALTISATGAVSGGVAGCSFSGTAAPHGLVNLLDVSITYSGATCVFDTGTFTGIAGYDEQDRGIIVMATDATRTVAFLFVGSK